MNRILLSEVKHKKQHKHIRNKTTSLIVFTCIYMCGFTNSIHIFENMIKKYVRKCERKLKHVAIIIRDKYKNEFLPGSIVVKMNLPKKIMIKMKTKIVI